MERKPKLFIGLDVHVRFTEYAVRSFQGDIVAHGRCATTYEDIKKKLEPYYFSCVVGIEATTCFYPLRNGLINDKISVKIANTQLIRTLVAKNDKIDAERLSDMLRLGSFPESYIPEKDIQTLRELVSHRHNVMQQVTKLKCRMWAAITREGIRFPVKNYFSKTGKELFSKLLKTDKATLQMKLLYDQYKDLEKALEKATNEMIKHAEKTFPSEWKKLNNLNGIGSIISSYLIAEICPISRFKDKKKLRRYAGVIPSVQESGGKKYAAKIPKFASRKLLRWALIQGAHHLVKIKDSSYNIYYKSKKIKQNAIMCISRMMSDTVFQALSK